MNPVNARGDRIKGILISAIRWEIRSFKNFPYISMEKPFKSISLKLASKLTGG